MACDPPLCTPYPDCSTMARWKIPDDLHSRIIQGPLCPFLDHSHGSLDGQIPRYDDSHACVRCISALTEGRLELSLPRIHPQFRKRFLEFWSLVDIGDPMDCWAWQGCHYKDGSSTYFPFKRHWGGGRQYSAPRVATWFTWGDIGRLPIKNICEDPFCCNPLHIRVQGVPHFYANRKLSTINLFPAASVLASDTQAYIEAARDCSPAAFARLERANAEWIRQRLAEPQA